MSDHCSISQQSIQASMDIPSHFISIQNSRNCRLRSRRRRQSAYCDTSRFILLALCFIAVSSSCIHAFSPSATTRTRTSRSPSNEDTDRQTRFYKSSGDMRSADIQAAQVAAEPSSSSRLTDFQRRMKGLVKRNGGVSSGKQTVGQRAVDKPANLRLVETLEEYKEAMDENEGKIIVVRFFATWCKACKAIQPLFYRMASVYPHITFLEVPVTNQNVNLHQGLEIPSLPFGHIYYPEAGLVEELKISKKYFQNLVKAVRWYDQGGCGVDEFLTPDSDGEK